MQSQACLSHSSHDTPLSLRDGQTITIFLLYDVFLYASWSDLLLPTITSSQQRSIQPSLTLTSPAFHSTNLIPQTSHHCCGFYRILSTHPCCIAYLLYHTFEPATSHDQTSTFLNMTDFKTRINNIIHARNLPNSYLNFPNPATMPTHCSVVVSNVSVAILPSISLPP